MVQYDIRQWQHHVVVPIDQWQEQFHVQIDLENKGNFFYYK